MTLAAEREVGSDVPRPRRWTVDECQQMERIGILSGHYELIYGTIYEKMPTNPPHILAVMLLARWLSAIFGQMRVRQEKPVLLPGEDRRPQPDVAVTREEATAYPDRLPGPDDLLLVAEVSDSTLPFDLATKARLYAQAGTAEYWALDLSGRCLHLHRTPKAEGYAEVRVCQAAEQIATSARPDISVSVEALLPALPESTED